MCFAAFGPRIFHQEKRQGMGFAANRAQGQSLGTVVQEMARPVAKGLKTGLAQTGVQRLCPKSVRLSTTEKEAKRLLPGEEAVGKHPAD